MWKFRADHVAASTIVLLVHDKTVVLVGSVAGLTLHRGGLAILGEPLTDHHLQVGDFLASDVMGFHRGRERS